MFRRPMLAALVAFSASPAFAQTFEAPRAPLEGESFMAPEAADASRLALRLSLFEMSDLADAARQVRWNVSGADGLALAATLETIEESRREDFERIAERMRALSGPVDGRPRSVARGVDLPPMPEGQFVTDRAVSLMMERLAAVTRRLRARRDAIVDIDPVTAAVLTRLSARVEADMGALRAHRVATAVR